MGLTRARAWQIYDIDYKQAVRVIATSNISLIGGAPSQVDGVNLAQDDRVLVVGQSTGSQNGIYVVTILGTGSNGTWTRAIDGNLTGEIQAGMIVMVTEGNVYDDTQWKLITDDPITVGVTSLVFEQIGTSLAGNFLPTANATYSLGNASYQWKSLYVAGNTIYIGDGTITSNATGISLTSPGGAIFTVTGTSPSNTIGNFGIVSATGNVIAGNVTTAGNISGNYILGNGAFLSGIGANPTSIISGNSNVSVVSAGGNVSIGIGGTSNVVVFATTGQYTTGLVSASGTITGANITGSNFLTSGLVSATGTVTSGNVVTGGTISATGNITGGNVLGGANVNATTHTGTTVSVSSNITGGNLFTGGEISATGRIQGANIIGGNITTVGLISATGTITGGNLATGGTVSATGNIVGGNVSGTILSGNLVGSTASLSGNVTGGNLVTGGLVSATGNIVTVGIVSATGNITGGNVSGTTLNGNLVGSTASLSGTITGGNLATGGTVSAAGNITGGNIFTGGTVSIAGTITGGNLATGGTISATGNVTGGNFFTAGIISATGNITGGNIRGVNIDSTSADVAERYLADNDYPIGTVLVIGGIEELTQSTGYAQTTVVGTVSEQPALTMNRDLQGNHVVSLAFLGRVPCRVVGNINRGDMLVSSNTNGVATAMESYVPGAVLGKALESYSSETPGVIEIIVGRL